MKPLFLALPTQHSQNIQKLLKNYNQLNLNIFTICTSKIAEKKNKSNIIFEFIEIFVLIVFFVCFVSLGIRILVFLRWEFWNLIFK